MGNMLTTEDLQQIREILEPRFHGLSVDIRQVDDEVMSLNKSINERIDKLTWSVDGFTGISRRHEQEWSVLRGQHEKTRNVLIKKGIASEDELSVTS